MLNVAVIGVSVRVARNVGNSHLRLYLCDVHSFSFVSDTFSDGRPVAVRRIEVGAVHSLPSVWINQSMRATAAFALALQPGGFSAPNARAN